MLSDLRDDVKIKDEMYDVCIIGAGIAGITIANEFIKNNFLNICMIESGSFDFEDETQDLYKGNITQNSAPHAALDQYRMRYFGGTSNVWGGALVPYDEIDFKKRSYIPKSGWEINRDELVPYYEKAMRYFNVGNSLNDYDKNHGEIIEGLENSGKVKTKFMIRADEETMRFSEVYKDNLIKNIDIYINGNVTDINPNLDNNNKIKIKTLNNKEYYIKSKKFIICTGGLESARLLLLSSKNYGDNVGRYYSPHWNSHYGLIVINKDKEVLNKYTEEEDGIKIKRYLSIDENTMDRENLLNVKITLEKLRTKNDLIKSVSQYFNETVSNIDSNIFDSFKDYNIFEFDCASGQIPNYNSRVMLNSEKDELGQARLTLNYLVSEEDKKALLKTYKIIGIELGKLRLGRIMYNRDLKSDDFVKTSGGASHHIGTTRMSSSSKDGVVDKNLKVFNTDNLYICSSSIFPTAGEANTTFTISAFAIRLANHLIKEI